MARYQACGESSAFSRRPSCSSSAEGGGHLHVFQWSGEALERGAAGWVPITAPLPGRALIATWLPFLACPRTFYASSQGLFSGLIQALLAIIMGAIYRNFSASPAEMCFSRGGVKPAQRAAFSDLHLIWHLCGYEIQLELWK